MPRRRSSRISQNGGTAGAIQGDMAVEAEIERMFAPSINSEGCAIWSTRADITGKNSRVEAVSTKTFREALDSMCWAPDAVRARDPAPFDEAWRELAAAIVFLSSAHRQIGAAGEYVWYAAIKGAMDSLGLPACARASGRRHPRQCGGARA